MRKVLKINAGIACSDRTNEVEPRPNEETKAQNAKPRRGEMCITDGEAQRNRRYNSGIACSDRANEVEPRSNEETKAQNAKPRRGEMCITDGGAQRNRRYNRGRFSRASFAMTVILIILIILIKSWFRLLDCFAALAMTVRDCFAEPVPNKVWGLVMTALFGRFCVFSHSLFRASAHFQFSIFN